MADNEDLPVLVRIAAGVYGRTVGWSVQQGVNTGNAALKLVLSEEGARRLTAELRSQLRRAIGVGDEPSEVPNGADPVAVLKERGAELLARQDDDDNHPAYETILASLAPDEARILRLIAIEGARAAVDVNSWRPLTSTSESIARGLTLIGIDAKLGRPERVPAYLSNLSRLGLVTFIDAPVDARAYDKLESQPAVLDALKKAGRGRITRRSIHMTAFGRAFSETCLPIDTAGFLAIQDDIRLLKR